MNGIWLLILLGRWSMVTGWIELFKPSKAKREFVSVDARLDDMKMNTDPRSYEMLSRDSGKNVMMDSMVTPDTVREGQIYPPIRSYLASTASPPIGSPAQSPDQSGRGFLLACLWCRPGTKKPALQARPAFQQQSFSKLS